MNLDQGTQLIDFFGLASRRGKLIATIAGGVILVTFWVVMALPNLYTSSAMVLVEPQSVDEELINSGVRKSDLNERLGLMTAEILSRQRLSTIITNMDLYQDEREDLERSEVVDLMRSYISVVPVLSELEEGRKQQTLKFNTFRIVFQHRDRAIAAVVAQKVANDFIDANIESRTDITSKSLDFMRDEIEALTTRLSEVEGRIALVKADNAGRLPEEFESHQRILQFSMGDLRDAQRILASAESDISYWKNQALTASSMSTPPGDTASPGHRLRLLEIEQGGLLARGFTNRHPDVVRVAAEIDLLRQQLSSAKESGDAPKSIGEQNALSELRRAEMRAVAAREDIERLRVGIADLEARLAGTPAVAEQLDGLGRQYEHLYRSYQDFSNRLQQASVQADLERRQLGERFRILEAAEASPGPSSPNRILLIFLGAVLGLAIGGGIGLIMEMSDSSMHTSNELQQALGIPVLASVPRIMLESDRVARSRRILKESIAAVALVVVVLVGGIVTYLVVNGTGILDSQTAESTPAETEARAATGIGRG